MFNFESMLFFLFSSIALIASIMVINAKNPVHSVLFLILVFCNSAGLFILLGVEFLAITFIIVYVGAIAILFLFVVMMLNIKLVELNENMLRYLPIGALIGLIFLFEIFLVLENNLNWLILCNLICNRLFIPQFFWLLVFNKKMILLKKNKKTLIKQQS